MPALPGTVPADQKEPSIAADRMRKMRQAVRYAVGREAGGQSAAAWGRGQRAVRAGPQLRQQAVERSTLLADQSGGFYARTCDGQRSAARRPLAALAPGDRNTAGDCRFGALPLR